MADRFEIPTAEDLAAREGLVGKRITIYWDGDEAFYACKVVSYDAGREKYKVLYENDPTGMTYEENLATSVWKIWNKSEEEYIAMMQEQVCCNLNEIMHAWWKRYDIELVYYFKTI